jgi:hypothetical protein
MQDGDSAYFYLVVQKFLKKVFPGKWVGKGGPKRWCARFHDLSPLYFSFWGYLYSTICATEVNVIQNLNQSYRICIE